MLFIEAHHHDIGAEAFKEKAGRYIGKSVLGKGTSNCRHPRITVCRDISVPGAMEKRDSGGREGIGYKGGRLNRAYFKDEKPLEGLPQKSDIT